MLDAFTRAVRERRSALDLTQVELARQVGCAPITLKKIEGGSLRPSRQLAERILRVLDVPAAERARLLQAARRRPERAARNPYKGLRAFGEEDAADFFGREALVARLLSRLADSRFLALVGPSGGGKSSAARAGLLPALRTGALRGSERWRMQMITPGALPHAALDAALRAGADLLLLDQLEELWALCPHEDEQRAFLDRLVALVGAPAGPRLLVTLRADFYDRPLRHHAFGSLLRDGTEVLLPLAPDEIARAVAGPAERAGVAVEPELLAACVADAERRAGALPLLQYALTELWERRASGRLTLGAYRAVGGVGGALTRGADELLAGLDDRGRELARQLFLRLVQPGEDGADTRRRARLDELPAGSGGVVELFAGHRLLTLDGAPGAATVELAHEALIGGWGRLCAWIDAQRDELRAHRFLAQAAAEWALAGRDASFLARGARLVQFEGIAGVALNDAERAFLDASVAERERAAAEERARQEALREALAQSEARRLASEALKLVREGGNSELIALLALRSLELRYTPQGDEALCTAATLELPLRHFVGHTGRIYCVDYHPDGRTAVSAGQDFVIREWEIATGVELRQLTGHTGNVRTLAFSSDGRLLASGGDDATVRVWDVAVGVQLYCLPHSRCVDGAVFASGGRLLMTWGGDPYAWIWQIADGTLLDVVDTGAVVAAAAWSTRGTTAALSLGDGRLLRWNRRERSCTTLVPEGCLACSVRFSPDDRMLLTSHIQGEGVRLWDASDGRLIRSFVGHADMVALALFTPDGSGVVSSSNDFSARLWDVASGAELRRFNGHSNLIWQHAVSPDGRLLLTGGLDGVATLWAMDRAPAATVLRGHASTVFVGDYTADGAWIASAGDDLTLRVWDASSGAQLACYPVLPEPLIHGGIARLPGERAVVLGCDDTVARVVDLGSGIVARQLVGHTGRIWGTAASPDGRHILTSSSDQTARLWDRSTGDLLHVLIGHTDLVVGAAFSPDGRLAITGSDDRTVRLWDVASGREVQRLTDPRFPMVYAAASPDGASVLTGSADGTVRLWSLVSGEPIWTVSGHHGYINGVRISADGRLGLTAGSDRTAKVWDLASGAEVRRLAGHSGAVYGAVFAPDGRHVLTASGDRTLRIWHLDWRQAAAVLHDRVVRDFNDLERAQYGIDA